MQNSFAEILEMQRMRHLTLFILLIFSNAAFAQSGKIAGRVTDNNNNPVPGATIKVLNGETGIASDVEGRFIITLDANQTFQLQISAVGFSTKNITEVTVNPNGVTDLEIILEPQVGQLSGVTVTSSSARKETVNALIQFQKNTNVVAQVISAEAIKRSPDKNTGEVLKRVPGTSIQDGKYIVIRGLADRYNQAMLNGVLLTSTEPDRKTFSYDIFPSAIIDNIIVNKTFIPEYSGEWAGGLIQINTKDIPSANFFSLQVGTGVNTNTVGGDYYSYKGGKLDFLGFDDGTRSLPAQFPGKIGFSYLPESDKIELGKSISTDKFSVQKVNPFLNTSLQLNGGLNTMVFGKNLGAIVSLNYSRSMNRLDYENSFYSINNIKADANYKYYSEKFSTDVQWGVLANLTMKLNASNKISLKNIFNVNTADYTTLRTGKDYESNSIYGENIRARELGFRSNIFYNSILSGDHSFTTDTKFNWYGSFNILDQYIPQQRRLQYNQDGFNTSAPYQALISNTLSQKSGSIFYSSLSDYTYSAGGDVTQKFNFFGNMQSIKGGYALQIKDRLYDARPFNIYLPSDSAGLRQLNEDEIFDENNFSSTNSKLFHFNEAQGIQYNYMANTILNAGYLQFDNNFSNWLRVIWGVRYEHFDQLVGSPNKSDERFVNTIVGDFLPSLNTNFKINNKTNIRLRLFANSSAARIQRIIPDSLLRF